MYTLIDKYVLYTSHSFLSVGSEYVFLAELIWTFSLLFAWSVILSILQKHKSSQTELLILFTKSKHNILLLFYETKEEVQSKTWDVSLQGFIWNEINCLPWQFCPLASLLVQPSTSPQIPQAQRNSHRNNEQLYYPKQLF